MRRQTARISCERMPTGALICSFSTRIASSSCASCSGLEVESVGFASDGKSPVIRYDDGTLTYDASESHEIFNRYIPKRLSAQSLAACFLKEASRAIGVEPTNEAAPPPTTK